jgi:lipid A disaccharide synthetase
MTKGSREKDIKLLVTKFMKLVESLNPGERLSIRKVAAKKKTTKKKAAKKSARTAGQRPEAKRAKS